MVHLPSTILQDLQTFAETKRLSDSDVRTIRESMMPKLVEILEQSKTAYKANDALCLGGSLSKGTGVKNMTDADVIIFKVPPKKGTMRIGITMHRQIF